MIDWIIEGLMWAGVFVLFWLVCIMIVILLQGPPEAASDTGGILTFNLITVVIRIYGLWGIGPDHGQRGASGARMDRPLPGALLKWVINGTVY